MKSENVVSIAVLLLLNLVGCTPEETVTVSGAVSRPGDVAFRPGWGVHNYVTAAGGYLAEADTGRVALVREMADSVLVGQRGSFCRWMIEDVSAVMAGDMISVPLKAYRVRFDTVLAVRNLEQNWKDHIYRMERGKVALGTTLRGVVAAVFFGNGEVIKQTSGTAAGPFQYLYLTMHPDRSGVLLPALREPVSDLEAQEDAACPLSGWQGGDRGAGRRAGDAVSRWKCLRINARGAPDHGLQGRPAVYENERWYHD